MARKPKEIDLVHLRKLAAMQCTNQEIASFFEVSKDTIERRFPDELARARQNGKSKIRQGLWQLADKGNLGALIWLSKQHLGMSEQGLQDETPKPDPAPLTIVDLNELQKQALMVLAREIAHLLQRSSSRKLEHDEAVLLSNNIKLINELKELKAIDEIQKRIDNTETSVGLTSGNENLAEGKSEFSE